jgi:hypothetical protein
MAAGMKQPCGIVRNCTKECEEREVKLVREVLRGEEMEGELGVLK